jgi:hypothetical protein
VLPFASIFSKWQHFFLLFRDFQGYRAVLCCLNDTFLHNGNRSPGKTSCHFSNPVDFGNKKAKQAVLRNRPEQKSVAILPF